MSTTRRGVGLAAFSNSSVASAQYASHGTSIRAAHVDSLQTQISVFQQLLHQFSITHGKEIRSNPTFRAEFARMCNAIGVDPLAASARKPPSGSTKAVEGAVGGIGNLWSQMLGGSVNDFYFELGVRVVEVCRDTRAENGGMMSVGEVRRRVQKGKAIGGGMEVTEYVEAGPANAQVLLLTENFQRRYPARGQVSRTSRIRLHNHETRDEADDSVHSEGT